MDVIKVRLETVEKEEKFSKMQPKEKKYILKMNRASVKSGTTLRDLTDA